MLKRYPSLPRVWLVTDDRNDADLERVMAAIPGGSGVIFRHYGLAPSERRARFEALRRVARRRRHRLVLSGDVRTARQWGAAGAYGSASRTVRGPALLRLVTVHSLRELGRVTRATAVLLSPVFATRSHPGARPLGPLRFRMLARRARVPVIPLGGMTAARARRIGAARWAAIDGLTPN